MCVGLAGFGVSDFACVNQVLNFMSQAGANVSVMPYCLVELTIDFWILGVLHLNQSDQKVMLVVSP